MKHLLIGIILLSFGCAHIPVSLTTTRAKISYSALQIAVRVNELQDTAIEAEKKGGLSTDTTRIIVTFCVDANKVLKTAPDGYSAIVNNLWLVAKSKIPNLELKSPILNLAISALESILKGR